MNDYWQLLRPRIVAMVLLAMAVAAWISGGQPPDWFELLHALFGTALVIIGAIALNQRLESRGDAKMPGTAPRPLPARRLTNRQVTVFGLVASAAGLGHLWYWSHAGVLAVAVASWLLYVCAYTPLKSITMWQTPLGALAGAMPVLLGAAVVHAPMSPMAMTLFAVVFFWQFPHAMAIAWLYRDQFANAGVRLATVVDASGRIAGSLALFGAAVLLPASLGPVGFRTPSWPYATAAVVLGAGYLACAGRFMYDRNDTTARWLLRASIVYLPLLFIALLAAY